MISENARVGFIYSFDLGQEIDGFKILPEHLQSNVERHVVDVIYESFVVPGDHDYLMSRLLAQNGLPRGFYWAAAQAIEKYLKAFLLMNGEGVKEFGGHPIKKLFGVAATIDSTLVSLDISPHQSIIVKPSVSDHLRKFAIADFLDEIEKHGTADNRYNAFGVEYSTGHLCALDSLLFKLRQQIGAISINESLKKINPDLILTFEKNNPWFHTKENLTPSQIPSEEFPIQYSSSVTKLEFLIKNESNTSYGLALRWLRVKLRCASEAGYSFAVATSLLTRLY